MHDYKITLIWHPCYVRFLFSRDEATLYERVSVRWSVRWSVGPLVGYAFVFRPTRSDGCRVYGPFTCS